MKKQWKEPILQGISIELTQGVEPIILSTLPIEPMYAWKCPCCGTESGYIFASETEARTDFYANHLPVCPNYDSVADSCTIS